MEAYHQRLMRMLRPVLEGEWSGWRVHIKYCNTGKYHAFLKFHVSPIDGQLDFDSAIFVSERGVEVLVANIYVKYAVYKYLVASDERLLMKWLEESKGGFEEDYLRQIFDWLREEGEKGNLTVIDEGLYRFFKMAVSMHLLLS
jgi:hypothetical protein